VEFARRVDAGAQVAADTAVTAHPSVVVSEWLTMRFLP
jgi:hypothetical protein